MTAATSFGPVRIRTTRSRPTPWLFLAPFLLVYLVAMLGPLLYSLYTSLFSERLVGGTHFTGLSNYTRVLSQAQFWTGVERVVILGVIQVPVMLLIALGLALLLDIGITRWGKAFRLVYFLPYAVPAVVGTLMWGFLLQPGFGAFDRITDHVGLGQPAFLGVHGVLPTIGFIAIWQGLGFNVIILYTALRNVPEELTESAVLDGARLGSVLWRIKVPLVRGAIGLTAFLGVVGTLQIFSEPYVLSSYTSSITSAYTPNMYVYNSAFASQDFSYAAAISFVLAVATILAAAVVLVTRRVNARHTRQAGEVG